MNSCARRSHETELEGGDKNAISQPEAAIEGDGVELRMQKLGGGMTAAFVRVPKGADFRPALAGPASSSTRPARPSTGAPGVEQVAPVRAVAQVSRARGLEDSEYVDFSPTDEFSHVIDHIKANG